MNPTRKKKTNLGCGDAVDEADLLESPVAQSDAHLPARVHLLVHHLDGLTSLIGLVLEVQVHVVPEVLHLNNTHKHCRHNFCRSSSNKDINSFFIVTKLAAPSTPSNEIMPTKQKIA